MKVVWFGIAIAFLCLAIASLLHFFYITSRFPHPSVGAIMGVPTGVAEVYSLAWWTAILEFVGFGLAFFAALVDARENHAKK
jgi:hypothetical protein